MPDPTKGDKYGSGEKFNASDVSYFGELDTSKDYPPGTMVDLGDGKPIDLSKVPNVIGGKGKGKPPK